MSPRRTAVKTVIEQKIQDSRLPVEFICQKIGVNVRTMFFYRTGKIAAPYEVLVRLANFLTERGTPCTVEELKEPGQEYRGPGRPKKPQDMREPARPLYALPGVTLTEIGAVELPVWQYIAAGPASDESLVQEDRMMLVPEEYAGCKLLRVSGESMTGRGIHPGDVLAVDESASPRNGNVVIAEFEDGSSTVGTLRIQGRKRWLEKASAKHKDIPIKGPVRLRVVRTSFQETDLSRVTRP